jgi:hypothetical protein
MPWFHGKITREEAEKLLNAQSSPGTERIKKNSDLDLKFARCILLLHDIRLK